MSASGGRHARLTEHEQELGAWSRARRPPDPRLSGVLDRELLGYQHFRAEFTSWLEPSSSAARSASCLAIWAALASSSWTQLTLMIDLDGAITADGQKLPDAWIGGLGDTYTQVGLDRTYGSIDLKLHPLGAYPLLGFPLRELTGRVVALADVFGSEGPWLPIACANCPIGTTASTRSRHSCWGDRRRRRPPTRQWRALGNVCVRRRGRSALRPWPPSWAAFLNRPED